MRNINISTGVNIFSADTLEELSLIGYPEEKHIVLAPPTYRVAITNKESYCNVVLE